MKTKPLVFFAIIVLIAVVAYTLLAKGISREDVGQLTVSAHASGNTYCTYVIKAARPEPGVDAFYSVDDIVCLECCDTDDNTWPPKIQNNQLCYTYITFTSGDGHVVYDADIKDRTNRVCTTCASARGYYACPD
ncbi:MAG: hypothetical protein DRI70_08550 [Bacteroidetes bacterium]|nr:MAG: hypothetical protein DRI70_08550 [Bacteroidota bacterium]